MAIIKNVAIIGGSGSIGKPILDALVASGKFNVTAVTRESSKATFPSSVKVVFADYTSVESVTAAFKGQDAVISAVGFEGLAGQPILIDAAVAAGVKHFLPSEFGSNLDNPNAAALPVFAHKIPTQKHLKETAAANPGFSYTTISTGPFLDWCLEKNLLLDLASEKTRIYDGGDRLFSTTTLASVALAVVGVLTHYEEVKNRRVYVQEMTLSQNRILEIAKKIAPEKKWDIVHVNTEDVLKSSNEAVAKGDYSTPVMLGYLSVAIFGDGYGTLMERTDNELLGVPSKGDADVEALLKPLLAA